VGFLLAKYIMNSNVEYYRMFTLVDITKTGVTRVDGTLERDQQRNYETVVQAISLITQPYEINEPICTDVHMEWLEFGEYFQGVHKVWVWQFAVEHSDIFRIGPNPVGKLSEAFDQIPIICGLEETGRFMLPIFYPYGAIKNVYFKQGYRDINNI
jgi:hypothetical protein